MIYPPSEVCRTEKATPSLSSAFSHSTPGLWAHPQRGKQINAKAMTANVAQAAVPVCFTRGFPYPLTQRGTLLILYHLNSRLEIGHELNHLSGHWRLVDLVS